MGSLAFDPHSLDLHCVATMATSFMTLAIQRAEHCDIQALQAKRGPGGAHYASPEATKCPRD